MMDSSLDVAKVAKNVANGSAVAGRPLQQLGYAQETARFLNDGFVQRKRLQRSGPAEALVLVVTSNPSLV